MDPKSLKALAKIMNPGAEKLRIFDGIPMARGRFRKPRKQETKPRQRTEGVLSDRIREDLKVMEWQGMIVWHDRLNSGRIETRFGYWIKLCREGTADIVVYGKDRLVVFIETKAKTKHTDEQIAFGKKMTEAGHKYFLVKTWDEWVEIKKIFL